MKEEVPQPAADEIVYRPTDKVYPREQQIIQGKRAGPEFDFVILTVEKLADVAQIYADFSKKEVRVPRNLLDRTIGIASTGKVLASYLIQSYDRNLPEVGIDIVPLGRDVVAFRVGKSLMERMAALQPAAATPGQIAAATAVMSLDRFWQLMEAVNCGGKIDSFQVAEALQVALSPLSAEEILGFHIRLHECLAESYRWDLWAVAYLVNGGCSDDGFEYFRAWLIAQGREYFQAALKNPARAADRADRHQRNECEQILYVASETYQAKMNQILPTLLRSQAPEPAGKRWDEEDLPRLYPELVKRFN